jgi:hypothetical protein
MKLHPGNPGKSGDLTLVAAPNSRQRERGIMLVECLVYISVWSALLVLAFAAFYRVYTNAVSIRRTSADIVRAVNAGERWREDVHRAIGPLRLITTDGTEDQALHIPQQAGEVVYYFTGTNLMRRVNPDTGWMEALAGLKSSRMIHDVRARVSSWRWEVELQPGKRKAAVRPLFTFQAVPVDQPNP